MDELIKQVEQWAINKGLDKAESSKQYLKVSEEVGEVAAALARNNLEDLKDGIGDVIVTLIILGMQNGLNLDQCLSQAYDEIKDRKGKTVNGVFVKDTDLKPGDATKPGNESKPGDATNLLTINVKDLDSVPEVYYRGERVDAKDYGLTEVSYRWITKGDSIYPDGLHEMDLEYLGTKGKDLDKHHVTHERYFPCDEYVSDER